MRKLFKKIHIWLAIPVGLFISLICFTGAVLVFETEITEYCNKQRFFIENTDKERLSISEIVEKVTVKLPDSVSIINILIPSDVNRTYRLGLNLPKRTWVYVNPYTGEITDIADSDSFLGKVRQLHRWLLFKGDNRVIGKRIVGISTIIMIVILISGLIIWLPRNIKVLRNRLKFRLKSGRRLFWYDFHVSGGFYALLLLLIMAFTGLTWSFEWYRNSFYSFFGADMKSAKAGSKKQNAEINYIIWDKAISELTDKVGTYKTLTVSNNTINVVRNKVLGNIRAYDSYSYNSETGEIIKFISYSEQPKYNKIRGWVYSIHTGSWGGIIVKFIYLIAVLIGAILPLTGYYLYYRKKKKLSDT